jgi:hypothetical protein
MLQDFIVEEKLSPEFAARLQHLNKSAEVEAIVVSNVQRRGSTRRQSTAERNAAIKNVFRGVAPIMTEIDLILHKFGGRRQKATAVGTITVATTADGIRALARLPSVQAVLENQPITRLPGAKRPTKPRRTAL